MKKIHMFAALLAMLLPSVLWGADVTTYDELVAALASSETSVMIPRGTTISAASATTLTIPSGMKLTVYGKLTNVKLEGAGTLAHNWKTITQAAEVHTPFPLGTKGKAGTANGVNTVDGTAGMYLVTSVADDNNVTTACYCSEEFFVTVVNNASGRVYYSTPSTSKPVGVLCTVAREKALNWIDGVSETVYTDCATLLTASATSAATKTHEVKDTNKLSVLLAAAGTVTYDGTSTSSSGALGFAVDLASTSMTLTTGKQWNSLKLVRFFNGSVTVKKKVMNTNFCVYNCSGTFDYLSGSSYYTAISLYDSPNVAVTWQDMASTTPPGGLNFYGGGKYLKNKIGCKGSGWFASTTYGFVSTAAKFTQVYWGTFESGFGDPTTYLYNTNEVKAEQDSSQSNAWVVKSILPDPNASQVLINGEAESSFADAIAKASQNDVIALQKNIELDADQTLTASGVRIDLNGFQMTGSNAIINNGDLEIIDENGNGKIDVPVINNGTLLLSSAKYNGPITLNSGFSYFLAGTFNGGITVASSVEDAKSVAEVCGGTYATLTYAHGGQNKALVDLCENGYVKDNAIAPIPVSYVTNPSFASYNLSALDSTAGSLYTRNAARSGYTREEWIDLCKIKAASTMFSGFGVDCAIMVDRRVAANDLSVTKPFSASIEVEIAANNSYSALFQAMRLSGMATAPWTYGSILPGGAHDGNMSFALSNKEVQNGTLCRIDMRLATDFKNMSGPKDWSYTEYVTTATRKLVLGSGTSNKAMIRPATGAATFYATLGAAMEAAADGGTVMLANDCTEGLALNKAGIYTFDTMGFAASDAVSVNDGLFVKSETAVDSSAKVLVPDAKATTYVVAQKVASVGGTFYDNLTEAVGAANGATVTLLAATDETITLGEGQSFTLNKNGIAFDDAKVTTSVAGSSVKATTAEGVTTYSLVKDVVSSGDVNYPSIEAAVAATEGGTVAVTVIAADTETIALVAGKTLSVTVADGVTADVTVNPAEGAFIETSTDGATTTYVSKKITVEMAEPQAAVAVTKIDNGTESDVTDTAEIAAAVAKMTGNNDVPRTDNTDKLDVLDKITVTPTKIVEEVKGGQTVIRSATFDVTPNLNAGQSLAEGQKLKFRLPVDVAATQSKAIVYHGDARFGMYTVQTYNNEKFIEVAASDFSPYGYELLDAISYNDFVAALVAGNGTFDGQAAAYDSLQKDAKGRLLVVWSPQSGCRAIGTSNHQYAGCDHVTEATYETPNRVNGGCAQYQVTASMVAGDISISNVSFIYDNVGDQADGSFWYDANGWNGTGASGLPGELQLENHGNITIANCSFDGVCLTPYHEGATTTHGLTVTESDFLNNAKSGLRGINSKSVTVTGCTFTDCDKGVDFVSNTGRADGDIVLTDNVFDNVTTPFKLRTMTQKVNVTGNNTVVRNSPSGATLFSYDTADVDVAQYLSISGGTYDLDVTGYTAPTFSATDNGDGTWTVEKGAGYGGEVLPAAPIVDGNTITVTPENIQYTLDGAYGSIDGKTIVLSEGTYPKLYFARATKFPASGTEYYKEQGETKYTTIEDIQAHRTEWGSCYYNRTMQNVTFKPADGATVTVAGIECKSGHVYGPNQYDYLLDYGHGPEDTGSMYYLSQTVSNITFDGLTFTDTVNFHTSAAGDGYDTWHTTIAGVTFDGCTFNGPNTTSAQAVRYYSEAATGYVSGLTVTDCTFNNWYQGVYCNGSKDITVTKSEFDTTGHNAIAVQTQASADTGAIAITDNTFKNIGDRVIRFGSFATGTEITITGNTATNSGDSDGEVIKASGVADGIPVTMASNTWDQGAKSGSPEFGAAGIGTTYYMSLTDAIAAANSQNVDEITILNGATESPDAAWKVADGKLVRKVYVAQIDTTKYESLAAAVAAVPTDGTETTITMIAGETLASSVTFPANTKIVLDLNGQTIDNQTTGFAFASGTSPARFTFIANGDLTVKDSATGGNISIAKANNATTKAFYVNGKLTVESGTIRADYSAAYVNANGEMIVNGGVVHGDSYGININKSNGHVTINGGSVTASGEATLCTNGNEGIANLGVYDINGGTIENTGAGAAIYNPNRGTTINIHAPAVITGGTGIVMKGGTLNVDGGTISGTGAFAAPSAVNSGFTTTGDALYVEDTYSTGGINFKPTVNITGGTFNSANGYAAQYYTQATAVTESQANGSINISGNPTLTSAKQTDTAASTEIPDKINIAGGSFTHAVPEEYCADGYIPAAQDTNTGLYSVKTGSYVAQIGTTKYETIDELLAGLQTAIVGGSYANTITFLADVELADNFVIPQEMAQCPTTFDLNGKHITLATGKTHAIRNNGQITLVDSVGGGSVTAPIPVINESGATFNMQGGTLVCNEQGRNAVQNEGTFNMTGGSLQVSYVGSSSDPFGSACLSNSGTATITKGTLTSVNQRAYAIINSGTLTINPAADSDVAVTGAHGAVAVDGGTVSISGGSYTATNYYALYVSNEASDPTVTVTGGTFDGNAYSAYIGSDVNESVTASVAISGGTFNDPIIENDKVADGSGFAISGGNFTTAVAEDYCATGYIPAAQDSETGMYTVKQGAYVAQVGTAKYESLVEAIAAANDGDTVQLLADVDATGAMYSGDTRYNLWIDKSITVNGDGHVLTVKGRGVGVKGASGKIDVTFKDVTIANSSAGARCIDTRGNLNSLTLDHATLDTNGATSGYTQPLTIGGSQSDKATVSIVNGSKIQTNDEGTAYYAIITFNPVNMTIDDSTIKGWACIYAKGPDGSAGSAGSVFTITDSELVSKNVSSGETNAFGMLMAEDNNVTFNVTNTKIDVNATGDQPQAIVATSDSQTDVAANLGEGNEVTLSGEATFESNKGSAVVSGGTFNVAVPEEACAEGYIPAAQDPNTGLYTVKEGTYVAQIVRGGEVVAKYETLAAAIADAQTGDTVQLLADVDATGAMYSGDTRYNLWIDKSITVNGDGHVLTVKGRGVGVKGASGKIDVTFKDVTIANSSANARCIDTRGNLNSLTLDNAKLLAPNTGTQPLTIGGNQADAATVAIKNGSVVQTKDDGSSGYAIITFNPVNMTIEDSTIKGWACIYAKGPDSSAGSAGSVFTITGSELVSKNVYSGESNAFSMLTAEDDNVTFNITDTKIDVAATGDQHQAIVGTSDSLTGVTANLGEDNEVTLSGKATFEINSGSAVVSGGIFNVEVPEDVCADGMIPTTLDAATGKYGVKQGAYVAQIVRGGEVVAKYETLEDAFAAAVDGDTILMIADANLASTAVFSMASANASVVLDLNGKSVVRDGTKAIEAVKGILTIVDNSEDGSGSITAEGNTIYLNQGMYNGRVEIAGGLVCAKDYNAVRAYNGNAVIRGGTVKASQCTVVRYEDDPWCDVEITGDAVVVATDGWTIQSGAGVPDNVRFAITGGMVVNESEENPLCWYDVYGASFDITGGRFCSKVAANADPECRDEDIETGEVYETWYSFEDSIAEGYMKSPVAVEGYEWAYEVEKVIATLSHGTTSTSYASLDAAVAAAQDGDTVTMLDNVTLTEPLNVTLGDKAVTLDLGGKTLAGRTNLKSGSLTIKNGTVAGGSAQALNVYGSADSTAENYSVLTIASDVNVTADVYGVCMFGATAGSNGYGAVVNIAGNVATTGDGKNGAVFVSGNLGKNVSGDAHNVINVTGTITSATDAAIAMNGLATVNVSDDAEVTGNTAIAVKRGVLNVTGGTIHATGEKNYDAAAYANGTEMTGAAISLSDTYSQYGAMSVSISGGTVTSDNADALFKKDGDYKADATIAVSAGSFSSVVPEEFCATGYIPTAKDPGTGMYTVKPGEYVAQIVRGGEVVAKYESLAEAIEAANDGDTVQLLKDITDFTETQDVNKSLVLDGAGHTIKADASASSIGAMFNVRGDEVVIKNLTINGDHKYWYCVQALGGNLALQDMTILNGAQRMVADDAENPQVGYGSAVHVNGANLSVSGTFTATGGGKEAGVFPFTEIIYSNGTIHFEDDVVAEIGDDLLLVGFGPLNVESFLANVDVAEVLEQMNIPDGYIPYSLTLGGSNSDMGFIGASPRTWNTIVDYGKEIMEVATESGIGGFDMDPETTPAEVGLMTDTVIPGGGFTYQDDNFSVNGNGNALSGTIVFTDDAEGGMLRNIKLGTEGKPLVLDLTQTTNAVDLGAAVTISDITVKMTEDQARLGKVVFDWDPESVTGDDVPNHGTVEVTVVDDQGGATGDTKSLVWDEEYGIAYIGPVEVRLSGPGKEPSYMDLTNAFDIAAGGDTITLFSSGVSLGEPVYLPAGTLLFATNKYELALGENAAVVFTNATTVFRSEMDMLSVLGLGGDVASGYILRAAVDNTTNVYTVAQRGEYIVTGNTEDGGVGTAVIKVSDEWIAEHIGANVKTANQVETFLNSTNSTTNLREWEMYVLNQATPFRVTAVGKADNAVSTTLVAPASSETTGFTVAYSLDETLADGSVKTPGTRQASRDFAVPVASVTTHAFYRVRAHLTSGESTLVVDSANTIGVLKATASTAQTIVAVPWAAFGGGDIAVADLLRTDGLSADDELFVYNPSTQNFRAWTLGSGKTWEPTTVIAAGTNATPGDDASSVTVARGSGVLLKRGSVSAPLCFVGEVASGGKTALGAAQTSGSDGAQSWNLVASPSVEALDIANFPAPSSGGWDRIIVLTSGAPLNLTYKNGKWGYVKVVVDENGMAVPTRVTEGVSIPAGIGFWYLNSGAAREIEW